jgi:hypothetical protein
MYFEETMSREYLQGLVQMKKQADHARHIDEYVKKIAQKIGAAASTGATCYLYEMKDLVDLESKMRAEATGNFQGAQAILRCEPPKPPIYTAGMTPKEEHFQYQQWLNEMNAFNQYQPLPLPPTLAPLTIIAGDIVEALKLKCPGCDVAHQESWVDTAPGTRVLKSGIYISWE